MPRIKRGKSQKNNGNDGVEFCSELNNQAVSEDANPAGIYLLKVNNRNTRTRCEICSKLTIKTPERSFWCLYC